MMSMVYKDKKLSSLGWQSNKIDTLFALHTQNMLAETSIGKLPESFLSKGLKGHTMEFLSYNNFGIHPAKHKFDLTRYRRSFLDSMIWVTVNKFMMFYQILSENQMCIGAIF